MGCRDLRLCLLLTVFTYSVDVMPINRPQVKPHLSKKLCCWFHFPCTGLEWWKWSLGSLKFCYRTCHLYCLHQNLSVVLLYLGPQSHNGSVFITSGADLFYYFSCPHMWCGLESEFTCPQLGVSGYACYGGEATEETTHSLQMVFIFELMGKERFPYWSSPLMSRLFICEAQNLPLFPLPYTLHIFSHFGRIRAIRLNNKTLLAAVV